MGLAPDPGPTPSATRLFQRRTGEPQASGGTPVNDNREIICKGIIILTLDGARLVRS
jgi:hypothetical protein